MSKYSKIFFGQKKYHDIQPFRFPIYNDLVAGEIEGIEALARKQASNTYALLKIAKDVAQKQDIPVQDALDALSDVHLRARAGGTHALAHARHGRHCAAEAAVDVPSRLGRQE